MRIEELKKQLFTIPNILTYLRILAVPFFMWLTIDKSRWLVMGSYEFPFWGFLIMIIAASTDLVDGYLARKLNQTSDFGAALDPAADKLMHVATLISLVVIGFTHWAFLILIMLKEVLMIVGGMVVIKYAQPIKANMTGKIASAILSLGVFLTFFHPVFAEKVFYLDWIIIGVAIVLTYVAFAGYIKQVIPTYKIVLKALHEGKDPNDYFFPEKNAGEDLDRAEDNVDVEEKAD